VVVAIRQVGEEFTREIWETSIAREENINIVRRGGQALLKNLNTPGFAWTRQYWDQLAQWNIIRVGNVQGQQIANQIVNDVLTARQNKNRAQCSLDLIGAFSTIQIDGTKEGSNLGIQLFNLKYSQVNLNRGPIRITTAVGKSWAV